MMIIIFAVFILALGILCFFYVLRPGLKKYQARLLLLSDIKIDNDHHNRDIYQQLSTYSKIEKASEHARLKVRNLHFPIPPKPDQHLPGEDVISKSITVLDKNSLAFAGTEQFILMAFPPGQVADCLAFAVEHVISHASAAGIESLVAVKASILEGAVNMQNPEILMQCLKEFTHAVFDQLQDHEHAGKLLDAIDHQHTLNIFHSFVNWHTVTQGLEPAMHLQQHFNEIAHAWVNHSFDASHSIVHHVDVTLSPQAGGHFPVITLVISSVREIKLLNDSKTNLESSLKNVALDVAGTGVGALAGAKAGAIAGSFFPGLGTLIGGVVGAIGGAIVGRMGSNKIKHLPLQNALEDYRVNFNAMYNDMRAVSVKCVSETRRTAIVSKRNYYKRIGPVPSFSRNRQEVIDEVHALLSCQQGQVKMLKRALHKMRYSIYSVLPRNRRIIKALALKLSLLQKSFPAEHAVNRDPVNALKDLLDMPLLKNEQYMEKIRKSAASLKRHNERLSSMQILWTLNASNDYKNTTYFILKEFSLQTSIFRDNGNKWKQILTTKAGNVSTEKAKLGIA